MRLRVAQGGRHQRIRRHPHRTGTPGRTAHRHVVAGPAGPGRARAGLGLVGIEERVKALGGSLAVSSWPNRGTLLSVEIPLANGNG